VKQTRDPAVRFFDRLAAIGHEPLLRKTSGSTRFEIVDGRRVRRWRVRVDKGDVAVEPGGGDADCAIRADRKVFERVVTGRTNAVAAVLRGDIVVDGDWRLLVSMQRLFAGPPRQGKARS
jgi:putative sterol carrier protein